MYMYMYVSIIIIIIIISGAFLQVCRVEGSMDFLCALDGSRESVKCQVKSAE